MIKLILKLGVVALLLMPVTSFAHMAEKDTLQIIHPWSDSALEGENAIVHPTFMNNDEHKEYIIVRASSESAESVKFLKDGEVIEEIVLVAGDILSDEDITVEFVNLKKDLVIGEIISMTLYFKDGTELSFKLGVGQQTTPE